MPGYSDPRRARSAATSRRHGRGYRLAERHHGELVDLPAAELAAGLT